MTEKNESNESRIITGSVRVSSDEQKKKGQMIDFYKNDLIKNGVHEKNIIFELGRSGSLDLKDKIFRLSNGVFWVGYKIKEKRPEFYEWLEEVNQEKIDTHKVTKWDRFSRDVSFCMNVLDFCDLKKTNVVATRDSDDRRVIPFLLILAEQEADRTKERIKDNKSAKFEKGLYLGTVRLKGYEKTKKKIDGKEYLHLVPKESERPMIIDIFNPELDYRAVCDRYKINPSTYYNIRSNPFYCGYIEFEGLVKKGIHEPLISEAVWKRSQE